MTRIKQSVSWWCYENSGLSPETLIRAIKDIGYDGIDLAEPEHYPLIKNAGLAIVSIRGHVPLEDGLNKRENAATLEKTIREQIEVAAKWNVPNVVVFSGNRNGLDDHTGAEVTAETLRRVAKAAEDAGVTLVLELLNSKVDHPDYQCDSTAWGVKVVEMVGSPQVKLLYDIYHMQVMEGDVIRTIQQQHPHFGHYHTAGNPGRNEIGETQELNYPAIMRAILATGYEGYVGQEFVPTGDPLKGLRQAFEICNIAPSSQHIG